jgi:hypothetical protein
MSVDYHNSVEKWMDEYQQKLDQPDLHIGTVIKKSERLIAIGNGSAGRPMLTYVGMDRLGRLWAEDGETFTLLLDTNLRPSTPPGTLTGGYAPGEWRQFNRQSVQELRPWGPDVDMTKVSVSSVDEQAGSPKAGDWIARNPKDHDDQWLVSEQYFAENGFTPR